jgi:tetratricopeptide (TPR) repeat protein
MLRPAVRAIHVACLVVIAALAIAPASVARADSEDATVAARRHFERAEKLFALGRFEAALTEYEAAFEARPLPGFLFNIAQCHRNLGNHDAAIFSFRKYLRLSPEAENRDDVLDLIANLEKEKQRAEARRAAEEDARRLAPTPPPPSADRRKRKPIYTRWWFWTGVVAAGAGAGTGAYLLTRDQGVPDTDLGNVDFP